MKALFIGNDPALLDATSSSFARIRSYAEAIGSVHVLMTSREVHAPVADGPLTVEAVAGAKVHALRGMLARAKEIITAEDIEIVSAQDPFEHGAVAYFATRGTNVKLHVQVHTDFLSPWFVDGAIFRSPTVPLPAKNHVRRVVADFVLPKAHGIRVVSERVKQSLMNRYGSRIVEPTVIPIAVGTEVPAAEPLPAHAFPFALLTAGRLEPEKRIEDLIEAIAIVKDRYPAIGLIIVGDGSERARLMSLVMEKDVAGKVVFAGGLPHAWSLMRSAQGYIQASGYEGYGRTLVEAALARVPIITTDVGVVGEVLKGYDDVLATPPGDPTNLAYHMIALLEDRQSAEVRLRSAEAKALAHVKQYQNLPALIAADLQRVLGAQHQST